MLRASLADTGRISVGRVGRWVGDGLVGGGVGG